MSRALDRLRNRAAEEARLDAMERREEREAVKRPHGSADGNKGSRPGPHYPLEPRLDPTNMPPRH
jgi:hypothetical protein